MTSERQGGGGDADQRQRRRFGNDLRLTVDEVVHDGHVGSVSVVRPERRIAVYDPDPSYDRAVEGPSAPAPVRINAA